MSLSLWKAGTFYLCSACPKEFRVGRNSGDDIAYRITMEMLKKDEGKRPARPDQEIPVHYSHHTGLCKECHDRLVSGAYPANIEEIHRLTDELADHHAKALAKIAESISFQLEEIAASVTPEDLAAALGKNFDSDVGDIHATPKRRKRFLDAKFQQKLYVLENCIIRKVPGKRWGRHALNHYIAEKVLSEIGNQKIVRDYEGFLRKAEGKLSKLMDAAPREYRTVNIGKEKRLCDPAASEQKIMQQSDEAVDELFFLPEEWNLRQILTTYRLSIKEVRNLVALENLSSLLRSTMSRLSEIQG